MDKIEYMDLLYYKIGKQKTDFELQIQNQDGFMSKRRKYSDIGFSKDEWWLNNVNARTIMINEVILDIDPLPEETTDKFNKRLMSTCIKVLEESFTFCGLFESNRGVHIHLFFNEMFQMEEDRRKQFRTYLIKKYQGDLAKNSERTTIALELAVHWKSGKIKDYIKGNLFDEIRPIERIYPLTERQKELLKKFAKDDPFSKPDFKPKTFYNLEVLKK